MAARLSPRTVIEAFLPFAGSVPLADIYDTANLAGIADQPIRLAIRRMLSSGDIEQTGRGRAGSLTLTNNGRRRLERDRESLTLAYAQDAGGVLWDGRWRLIAVTTPERERAVRDTLRRELYELGAVAISTSLYVTPHDIVAALPQDARRYLSTASTGDLEVRGIAEPRGIAEALWPSKPTIAAYSPLAEAINRDASATDVSVVVRMLLLADALEQAIREDPLLPRELRAVPWPPSEVRAAWADRWDALSKQAHTSLYQGWWPPTAHS